LKPYRFCKSTSSGVKNSTAQTITTVTCSWQCNAYLHFSKEYICFWKEMKRVHKHNLDCFIFQHARSVKQIQNHLYRRQNGARISIGVYCDLHLCSQACSKTNMNAQRVISNGQETPLTQQKYAVWLVVKRQYYLVATRFDFSWGLNKDWTL
jgi:hypothetical protein